MEGVTPTSSATTDWAQGALTQALDYACDFARPFGARIPGLGGHHPGLGVPELGVAMTSSAVDSVMDDNQHGLDALVERYKHRGVFWAGAITKERRSGRHHQRERGRDHARTLIVMTTHGRTGVARWLLGSVAEQVRPRTSHAE